MQQQIPQFYATDSTKQAFLLQLLMPSQILIRLCQRVILKWHAALRNFEMEVILV
jgi:hypothetical protein